jgi:S-formylglutathione hydrolase FrmB
VKRSFWLAFGLLVVAPLPPIQARDLIVRGRRELEAVNRRLHGQVVDYTHNHGADRRIWSEALGQKRDVYVYLPPSFDPTKRYPLIIALHGWAQDERAFIRYAVDVFDQAMASGCMPLAIIVVPDGSVDGDGCLTQSGSFFINSKAGRFEDFVMQDVWNFVMKNYAIRPEREAHALIGVSMGGAAAFNLGIKHRDRFQVVAGIYPPVNMRYVDCHGRYMSHFDPDCQGLRTDVSRGHEVIGRFYGVVLISLKRLLDPIYDRKDTSVIEQLSRDNPFEMIDAYNLKEGDLSMFIAYGGRDEFNIDAQVESFLYKAKQKGLTVDVAYDPKGRHDYRTLLKLQPSLFDWLKKRLAAYGPAPE